MIFAAARHGEAEIEFDLGQRLFRKLVKRAAAVADKSADQATHRNLVKALHWRLLLQSFDFFWFFDLWQVIVDFSRLFSCLLSTLDSNLALIDGFLAKIFSFNNFFA